MLSPSKTVTACPFSMDAAYARFPNPAANGFRLPRCRAVALVAALLLFTSTAMAGTQTLRFQPHWVPQAQFAGFYLAKDMGWYQDAGVELEILPHGAEHPAPATLANEEADVALLYLTQALELREQGVDVVNVAQLIQDSSLVLVSLAESGIMVPEDLDGQRVSRWASFSLQPEALFRTYGVAPDTVDQGATMAALRTGAVTAAMATRYNELVDLYLSGLDPDEIDIMPLEDHGVGLAEDGIYVLESTLREHPDAIRSFVEVSLRGWEHAFAHPDAALDAVMDRIIRAGEPTNRAHQRLMLEALRPLYLKDETLRGPRLNRQDYQLAVSLMRNLGHLEWEPVPYEQFHRDVMHERP
ncbi:MULTISPECIES: ABC transporter substrate-binding protein [unclassified Thioalkalivibrio]|uniref:ABC transporter substrate-binding protein n=1 Tax=unclassified Thioalkalivibrio TaxID=2621013 RepID=UPI00037B0A89|nr:MULTISPECIES: ABC transporter substrate-binding protein [unclassified Thioalkalivibrio]